MKMARNILALAVAASLLAGCGMFNKLTGQRDDSVLPGAREDILSPDQQVNNKSAAQDISGDKPQCDPAIDKDCLPQVNQEGSGDGLQ
jgi:hypothetical protein